MGGERACLNSMGGCPKQPPKATLKAGPCGSQGLAPKGWPLGQSKAAPFHRPSRSTPACRPKQLKLPPILAAQAALQC